MRLEVRADRADRVRTGEVADERHDGIPFLGGLQASEQVLAGQIAMVDAGRVGRRLQVAVAGVPVARPAADEPNRGTTGHEIRVDRRDAGQVAIRQREPVTFRQHVRDGSHVLVEERAIGRLGCVRPQQIVGRGRCPETRRLWPREQTGKKFAPIRRQFQERLVHQVHVQVAAPDVGDERQPRRERDDVGEILVGPHAQIRAARRYGRHQIGQHRLERVFVGHEVVGIEEPVGLGQVRDRDARIPDR